MSALTEPEEIWLPVVGFEGVYSVSSLGRIRGDARTVIRKNGHPQRIPERIVGHPNNRGGYQIVTLRWNGVAVVRLAHNLVLEAFVGPRPEGLIGCHNDGNRTNNRPSNLRWDTYASNAADAIKHGVIWRGQDMPHSKLVEAQVLAIRADARPQKQIAREYNIDPSLISRIKSNELWTHL